MNDLKNISLKPMVQAFLDQQLTVCLIDPLDVRRANFEDFFSYSNNFKAISGRIEGKAMLHYSVVIIREGHSFTDREAAEHGSIPGVFHGIRPITIYVES